MGDCADSYESAICGFLVGGITLILRVIESFSCREIFFLKKNLPKMIGMDSF